MSDGGAAIAAGMHADLHAADAAHARHGSKAGAQVRVPAPPPPADPQHACAHHGVRCSPQVRVPMLPAAAAGGGGGGGGGGARKPLLALGKFHAVAGTLRVAVWARGDAVAGATAKDLALGLEVLDETDGFRWLGSATTAPVGSAWKKLNLEVDVAESVDGHLLDVSLTFGGGGNYDLDDLEITCPERALSTILNVTFETSDAVTLAPHVATGAQYDALRPALTLDAPIAGAGRASAHGAVLGVSQGFVNPSDAKLRLIRVSAVPGILNVSLWVKLADASSVARLISSRGSDSSKTGSSSGGSSSSSSGGSSSGSSGGSSSGSTGGSSAASKKKKSSSSSSHSSPSSSHSSSSISHSSSSSSHSSSSSSHSSSSSGSLASHGRELLATASGGTGAGKGGKGGGSAPGAAPSGPYVKIEVLDETADFEWLGAWMTFAISATEWVRIEAIIPIPTSRAGHSLDVALVVGAATPGILLDDIVVAAPSLVGAGVPVKALSVGFDDVASTRHIGVIYSGGAPGTPTILGGGPNVCLQLSSDDL